MLKAYLHGGPADGHIEDLDGHDTLPDHVMWMERRTGSAYAPRSLEADEPPVENAHVEHRYVLTERLETTGHYEHVRPRFPQHEGVL